MAHRSRSFPGKPSSLVQRQNLLSIHKLGWNKSCDNVNSSCCVAVTTSFLKLPFLCRSLTQGHANTALTPRSLLLWLLPLAVPRDTSVSALSPCLWRYGSQVPARHFPTQPPLGRKLELCISSGLKEDAQAGERGKGDCCKGWPSGSTHFSLFFCNYFRSLSSPQRLAPGGGNQDWKFVCSLWKQPEACSEACEGLYQTRTKGAMSSNCPSSSFWCRFFITELSFLKCQKNKINNLHYQRYTFTVLPEVPGHR